MGVQLPLATILLPPAGAVFGQVQLATLTVLVEFEPAGNNSIEPSAVHAGLVRAIRGSTNVNATSVARISGTNRYEFFSFPGLSGSTGGPLTVEVVSGWADSAGNLAAAAASRTLPVLPPVANLVYPFNAQTIDASVINSRRYIDVGYQSVTGLGIDPLTVHDSGAEFTLTGSGAGTVVIQNTTIQRLYGSIYRYFFTGTFVGGAVNVNFVAGEWADTAGNINIANTQGFVVQGPSGQSVVSDLSAPLDGTVIGSGELMDRLFVDVNFYPADGNAMDDSTIRIGDLAAEGLIEASGAGLSHDGSATRLIRLPDGTLVPEDQGTGEETNTYRFGLSGSVEPGELFVTIAGIWADSEGNPGTDTHAIINVENPRSLIRLPPDAYAIGREQIPPLKVLVEFTAAADNCIDSADISASLVRADTGSFAADASIVNRIADSSLFEFSAFTGLDSSPGTTLVIEVAAGWTDTAGNVGPASDPSSLVVLAPEALILLPPDGHAIEQEELTGLTVLVEFSPTGTNSIDPADIPASLVRVKPAGDAVDATGVVRVGGTNTFEFTGFSGASAEAGETVTVEVISGWADSAGNVATEGVTRSVEVR